MHLVQEPNLISTRPVKQVRYCGEEELLIHESERECTHIRKNTQLITFASSAMGAAAAASAGKRAIEASWCPKAMLTVWICEQQIGSCPTLRYLFASSCRKPYFIWANLNILEALVHCTSTGDVIKNCQCRRAPQLPKGLKP